MAIIYSFSFLASLTCCTINFLEGQWMFYVFFFVELCQGFVLPRIRRPALSTWLLLERSILGLQTRPCNVGRTEAHHQQTQALVKNGMQRNAGSEMIWKRFPLTFPGRESRFKSNLYVWTVVWLVEKQHARSHKCMCYNMGACSTLQSMFHWISIDTHGSTLATSHHARDAHILLHTTPSQFNHVQPIKCLDSSWYKQLRFGVTRAKAAVLWAFSIWPMVYLSSWSTFSNKKHHLNRPKSSVLII